MTSLETKEYFMPSVPIEIPSDIVIVLNITGFRLFFSIPELTDSANLLI